MTETEKKQLDETIRSLKQQIMDLGPMRPGSLSIQYKNRAEKIGPFHQLSYTLQGRSRSESVRIADVERVKTEVQNFQTFKRLCEELVMASLVKSRGRAL